MKPTEIWYGGRFGYIRVWWPSRQFHEAGPSRTYTLMSHWTTFGLSKKMSRSQRQGTP